jgi:hypothetical protein
MTRQEQINQLVASEDVAYDEAMERRTDAEWALRLKMESIAGDEIHDAIPDALNRRKWQALLDDEGDLAKLHDAYCEAQVAEHGTKRAYETALERAREKVCDGNAHDPEREVPITLEEAEVPIRPPRR